MNKEQEIQEIQEIIDLGNEIHNTLSEMDNDDLNLPILEKAMRLFCSNWDICEGYKHAIMETVDDQVNNHASEQDPKDFREFLDILNGAI